MGVHASDDTYEEIKDILGIPSDEPIFILRAKDKLAFPTLMRYMGFAQDIQTDMRPADEWFENLTQHANKFIDFKNDNPDLMRVPD